MRKSEWKYREVQDTPEGSILEQIDPILLESYPTVKDLYERRGYLSQNIHPAFPDKNREYYQKGADLICSFIEEKKPICIWGDYDIDGATSTSALVKSIELAGGLVTWGIPTRGDQGYGIHVDTIRGMIRSGGLVVTVDNGIAGIEEVKQLQGYGYTVLVTDHHLPGETVPDCVIINPKCHMDPSEDEYMASGAYVAAMIGRCIVDKYMDPTTEEYLKIQKFFQAIVALSIISDIIPINKTMRNLARYGLAALRTTSHAGLKALLETCGVGPGQDITSTFLSFRVLPKLNATGRMGVPHQCVQLILMDTDHTVNQTESNLAARTLEILNKDRKAIEKAIMKEAVLQAKTLLYTYQHSLVLYGQDWHEGVLGIIASRIAEMHNVPTLVVSGKDLLKGSGRSVNGFDLHAALQACEDELVTFGGHKNAAGLAVKSDHLGALREKFNTTIKETEVSLVRVFDIDCDVTFEMCYDVRFQLLIKGLEPFGQDNPEPVFRLPSGLMVVRSEERRGALTLLLEDISGSCLMVGLFRAPNEYYRLLNQQVDVLVSPTFSYFSSATNIEWKIVDIQLTNKEEPCSSNS